MRRGHGDLHLGNIVLIDGAPVLFDAIEFDPTDRHRRRALRSRLPADGPDRARTDAAANVVLNRYLAETRRADDLDALAALPLFLSMRAAIRAKVDGGAARRMPRDRATRDARARATISRWRCGLHRAAGAAAGRRRRPLRHRQVGARAGARARTSSPLPGAVVLRTDVERKALFGDRRDRAAARRRPMSREVTARVYAALTDKARRIARCRPFGDRRCGVRARRTNAPVEAMASSAASPFHGLFLTADLDARLARVGARTRDVSDADAGVARAAGALRPRPARLDGHRCLGNAGRNPGAGARGACGA